MNQFIVPYSQSPYPNVSMEVFQSHHDHGGENQDLSISDPRSGDSIVPVVFTAGGNEILIERRHLPSQSGAQYREKKQSEVAHDSISTTTLEFHVKLKIDDSDLKDLQYVMDVMVTPDTTQDEEEKYEQGHDEPMNSRGDRIQAKFLSSTSGCQNTRVYGRGSDAKWELLQISIPNSIFESEHVREHSVDLVAGWACGHEAVTLTQSIVFRLKPEMPMLPMSLDLSGKDVESMRMSMSHGHDNANGNTGKWKNEYKEKEGGGGEEDEELAAVVEEDEENDRMHGDTQKRQPQQRQEKQDLETKRQQFQKQYDKDTFGKAQFTANTFMTGLIVLLFVGGTILNALLAVNSSQSSTLSGRRRRKKRASLYS